MNDCKIPKTIHYCWFGGKSLTKEAQRCIASWKKYFPLYEIIEWNEYNYDVNACVYAKEAYEKKKWAFVSDYARFDLLYKFGGIYFDTDVEVIKSMDDIISNGSFMGLERGNLDYIEDDFFVLNSEYNSFELAVNPGLGLAAMPGQKLYKEILDGYKNRHFIKKDGDIDTSTVCHYVTRILMRNGIAVKQGFGYCSGIIIYPSDYFCPKNPKTGLLNITDNTRSIHLFSATWVTPLQQRIHDIEKKYIKKYGNTDGIKKSKKATVLYRLLNKLKTRGVIGTMNFIIKQLIHNSN